MKKIAYAKKTIVVLLAVMMLITNTISYAAIWWGNPGYEWALSNGLTGVKSRTQLNQDVSLSDFYATTIRYLNLKGIKPREETIQHNDAMDGIDNVAKGIFEIINSYTARSSLTIQQYYIVENYVEHGRDTLNKYLDYSQYLTRENVKNIELYLTLSQYRAAMLIDNRTDRDFILSKLGPVKNSEIIQYNIVPYVGRITRQEFLLVLYDLISAVERDNNSVIDAFYEADVLKGFDDKTQVLELDKTLTYSEMYSFLYRFENFDFGDGSTENEEAEE